MGVDTKGALVLKTKAAKDPFVISESVLKALQASEHTLIEHQSPYLPGRTLVEIEMKAESKSITFSFKEFDGTKRALKAFFDVDCDHKSRGNYAVSFFLGHFGKSVEIMRDVIARLQSEIEGSKGYIWPQDSIGSYIAIDEFSNKEQATC